MKNDIEVTTVSPTSKCVEKIITMDTQNGRVSERMASHSCVMEVIKSRVYMTELFDTSQGLMIRGSNPAGGKKFSFLQIVQPGCKDHPPSCSMSTVTPFAGCQGTRA